jgi:glycosyltransferase involved in cell wall biosynthesis
MPDFLVFATLVPKLLGAKILLDLHEPTPELWFTKYGHRMQFLLRLQTKMEQWAIKFADMAITVTDELRNRLIERGARPENIAIVRNVCDDDVFSYPTGTRRNRGEDGFCIITHGLIEERYGHQEMIRAVSSLRGRIPNLRLEILGSGEFETQLKQLVQDLNCSDMVHFLGYVPHDELMRRLQAAEVGIIAMRRSLYSELIDTNKMYEYVALRKPVIVSRLAPVERMFDDSCMKLYEPGDYQALARCIMELYLDPGRGRELVENAHKRYAKICWRNSKKEYVKIIDDLVAGRDRTRTSPGHKTRASDKQVCESVMSQ